MSAYISLAQRRLAAMRDAIDVAAEDHDLPLTVRQLGFIADVVTSTLYPDHGRADPALAIGRRTHLRRTGLELSDIELVVLRYAANGCSNEEIAGLIGRCKDTVNAHCRRAYAKIGAHDRVHAIGLLCLSGVLTADDVPPAEVASR